MAAKFKGRILWNWIFSLPTTVWFIPMPLGSKCHPFEFNTAPADAGRGAHPVLCVSRNIKTGHSFSLSNVADPCYSVSMNLKDLNSAVDRSNWLLQFGIVVVELTRRSPYDSAWFLYLKGNITLPTAVVTRMHGCDVSCVVILFWTADLLWLW